MSANQLKDVKTRLRLRSADQLKDIVARFILITIGTPRTKDVACRFVLFAPSDVIWVTRDGKAVWVTRDEQISTVTYVPRMFGGTVRIQTVQTSGGQTSWTTRDNQATWKARV